MEGVKVADDILILICSGVNIGRRSFKKMIYLILDRIMPIRSISQAYKLTTRKTRGRQRL